MNTSARYWKKCLLEKTDWTQLTDVDLTTEEKQAWQVYRQAVRDLGSDQSVYSYSWPVPPQNTFLMKDVGLRVSDDITATLNLI